MDIRLNNLNTTIINCKKCPRLVKFIHKVSKQKRKQNEKEKRIINREINETKQLKREK